jgi:brefeldin A-inhibited guanine nucleotide-exchange protein
MFEITWMPILTGLSCILQESDYVGVVVAALNGFKLAIHIAGTFDMDLELKAFFSTVYKVTSLNNVSQMKGKNFDAIKTILEVASVDGNSLGSSWNDVFTCIVQLDKLQSPDERASDEKEIGGIKSRSSSAALSQSSKPPSNFLDTVALEISSQTMTTLIDKIFTTSVKLSGTAIVCFVRSLCETSWEEISNTVDKDKSRMICLQRLVEISYYNMKRIRVEWSSMWSILGEHFNNGNTIFIYLVGCYPNTNVGTFAIDKLRQLSMKFLELEELPNFKFQKDFLRPFEEIIRNNSDAKLKDMSLTCIQQLVQAKGTSLRSGWKSVLGSLLRASREPYGTPNNNLESLVNLAFDIMKLIIKSNFGMVAI